MSTGSERVSTQISIIKLGADVSHSILAILDTNILHPAVSQDASHALLRRSFTSRAYFPLALVAQVQVATMLYNLPPDSRHGV